MMDSRLRGNDGGERGNDGGERGNDGGERGNDGGERRKDGVRIGALVCSCVSSDCKPHSNFEPFSFKTEPLFALKYLKNRLKLDRLSLRAQLSAICQWLDTFLGKWHNPPRCYFFFYKTTPLRARFLFFSGTRS